MINKFEQDSLKQRNNYIGELARSNDLYRQLGQVREEYEQHTRDFDEEVIANNQIIDNMIKDSEFLRKRNDENKHIIEQLVSNFDDKDRNIEELKSDLDDALNKINNLNYEIENRENKIYEKLQKIENNNDQLEKFIEIYDDKINTMLNKFKKNMETDMSNLHEEAANKMNKFDVRLNKLRNNIEKTKNYIKNNNKRLMLLITNIVIYC